MKKKLNDPNTEALQLDQSRNDNGPTARAVTNENIKILKNSREKSHQRKTVGLSLIKVKRSNTSLLEPLDQE